MMRVHFSAGDLARTRVATTWGPWAETVLCLGELRGRRSAAPFRPWREAARRSTDPRWASLAGYLRPLPGTVADLVTLVGAVDSFDDGAEALAARPDADLRTELGPFPHDRLPSWLAGLDSARPTARRALTAALAGVHERLVAPYWPVLHDHLAGERARLGRLLADHGVEHLFERLHPGIRWQSPVLEIEDGAQWMCQPLDAHLEGRGLVLVPTVFCGRVPIPLFPLDGGAAVLLVPVDIDLADAGALWGGPTRRSDPLADVLGRTRAAVLRSVDGGTTTTELARRLDISVSGASQHASVLRSAGLVASRRDRHRVVHTTTDLGTRLLDRIE